MHNKFLPTYYHLEVYEDSFANEPSYFVESTNAFLALSVGDYFDHRNYDFWQNAPDTKTEKFVIKQIEHVVFAIKDSHNTHKIMILLRKEPYSG